MRPRMLQTKNTQNRLKKLSSMYPLPSGSRPSMPSSAASRSSWTRSLRWSSRSWCKEGSMVTESVSSITSCTASLMRSARCLGASPRKAWPMNVVAMSTYDHRAAWRRRSRMSDRPKMTSPTTVHQGNEYAYHNDNHGHRRIVAHGDGNGTGEDRKRHQPDEQAR